MGSRSWISTTARAVWLGLPPATAPWRQEEVSRACCQICASS